MTRMEGTVAIFLRISTSPPSLGSVGAEEMSYYCDVQEITDWRSFRVVRDLSGDAGTIMFRDSVVGYLVMRAFDCMSKTEIGILLGYEDDSGEMMYLGIDYLGRHYREPAANEALWAVANVAQGLPDGSRLAEVAVQH